MYGWLTNTGIKFVIVIDMEGRPTSATDSRNSAIVGLRDADLKPAFRALQSAYIGLLRNPFYDPDHHSPSVANAERRLGSTQITSRRFINEVERIGSAWFPGVTAI
ncbi:hypothetical protein B0A49_08789 [Cryomyces minteri]|uniref:Trafficking protein particle complex subunit 2-like protein n=1 Tax=Cryomyces minteri TaxID=331657 RepID=A0A4U0WIK0_9PEZI|nr:hypothetical protein B0A49_08789 [Cryomyces minteri]